MTTQLLQHTPYRAGSITKARFLSAAVCPTAAWWDTHDPPDAPPSQDDRFRMEEGKRVHHLARQRFPGAMLVQSLRTDQAARQTRDLVESTGVHTIMEATFAADAFVARADVIVRESAQGDTPGAPDAWHLIEIKSGTSPNGYLADLAYTVMVARRAGLHVPRASLLLLDREYIADGPLDPEHLFVPFDGTEYVEEIIRDHFQPRRDDIAAVLEEPQPPPAQWRWECRNCQYFDTRCVGRGIQHPLFQLPGLRQTQWLSIMETGARGIRGIPQDALEADTPTAERWRRIHDCVRTGRPWVSDDLPAALAAIHWPARFLDFETATFALPVYPGTRPHEQIPTQYSLHVVESPQALSRCDGLSASDGDAVDGVSHCEFLASDPTRDSRRELVERLLEDLGSEGSVVVYSSFEKTQLRALAALLPEYAEALGAVETRLFDLCDLVRDHYYDAGFCGSFSIKKVLPVLAPDLSYEALGEGAVRDGGAAASRFADAAAGRLGAGEWEGLRAELLEYCKLDTWGMVRVLGSVFAEPIGEEQDSSIEMVNKRRKR